MRGEPEEAIKPPEYRTMATLRGDRIGMTAEELIERAQAAFQDLDKELTVLHRKLPL